MRQVDLVTPDSTGYPPPSQPPTAERGQVFQKLDEEVILVSCFDGIGSAALILKGAGSSHFAAHCMGGGQRLYGSAEGPSPRGGDPG